MSVNHPTPFQSDTGPRLADTHQQELPEASHEDSLDEFPEAAFLLSCFTRFVRYCRFAL